MGILESEFKLLIINKKPDRSIADSITALLEYHNLGKEFLGFYSQFFFLSKFQKSISDKVLTIISADEVTLSKYKRNDQFWFFFQLELEFNITDPNLTILPDAIYGLKISGFRFSSSKIVIDKKFCNSYPSLKNLILTEYDSTNSLPLAVILSKIHVLKSLDVEVKSEFNTRLIEQYQTLESLRIDISSFPTIDLTFLKNMKELRVLKLAGTFREIPYIIYSLEKLEELYINYYENKDIDIKLFYKQNLKYVNLVAFQIPIKTINDILEKIPTSIEVDIC